MRDPRPGLIWSTGRLARRAAYCDYMSSRRWFVLREEWARDWMARHGIEPCCLICGVPWLLERDDLHHRTYARLGHESCHDLISLCRSCHGELHRVLESDRSWSRLDRAQATDLIVKALRRRTIRGWSASCKTLGQTEESCR
jgi:5-methylcytosine-specific restriction endonuclease McrA